MGLKRKFYIKFLFPLLVFAGRIFPRFRTKLEAKIISLNNRLVLRDAPKPRSLFLLLPHCLQLDTCPHKITSNILNCRQCGSCDIASVLSLEQEYGIIIKVATGGRLAKKWVAESGSDMVVAVACERELTEGIIALGSGAPYVWAIENCRPSGPCFNTRVDVSRIKKALGDFFQR